MKHQAKYIHHENKLAFKLMVYIFVPSIVIFSFILFYNYTVMRKSTENTIKQNSANILTASISGVDKTVIKVQKIQDYVSQIIQSPDYSLDELCR